LDKPHEPATESQSSASDHNARRAKEELFEAIEHFKNAAGILFERATKDQAVRAATAEAERVLHRISATAEPLARQLTGELTKLTRNVLDAVDGKRKSEVPPPHEANGDVRPSQSPDPTIRKV
jgi:hypothetical protein